MVTTTAVHIAIYYCILLLLLFLLIDLILQTLPSIACILLNLVLLDVGCLVHDSRTGNFSNVMHLARGKHILLYAPMLLLSLLSAACKLGLVGKQTILYKNLFKFKIFQKLALQSSSLSSCFLPFAHLSLCSCVTRIQAPLLFTQCSVSTLHRMTECLKILHDTCWMCWVKDFYIDSLSALYILDHMWMIHLSFVCPRSLCALSLCPQCLMESHQTLNRYTAQVELGDK